MLHQDSEAQEQVRAWETQGLFTHEQILHRLDLHTQEILSGHLSQSELEHLEQNLDAITSYSPNVDLESSSTNIIDPAAFAEFLAYRSPDSASTAAAAAAPTLFRMLLYLSHYPLQQPPPPPSPGVLTRSGFRRAIVHVLPRLARHLLYHDRTTAEMSRVVFQSLAVVAAAPVPTAIGGDSQDNDDEMYNDMQDFLYVSQPADRLPWYADCPREGFGVVAKELCWSAPLRRLLVEKEVMQVLAELGKALDNETEHDAGEVMGELDGGDACRFDEFGKFYKVSTQQIWSPSHLASVTARY